MMLRLLLIVYAGVLLACNAGVIHSSEGDLDASGSASPPDSGSTDNENADSGTSDGGALDAGFTGVVEGEPAELQGITNAHNTVRATVGVAPTEWDDELAAIAQAWADGCQWGHNPGRSDTYPGYVGENIYGGGGVPTGQQVTDAWASEVANYDYETNSCSSVCGHYTQIVWADSIKLGCGFASCPGGTVANFVVCNYAPGGNIVGQKPY
jgi:hypothetical protein